MTSLPEPHVTGYLHGGPRNNQTLQMPWARYYVTFPDWDTLLGDKPRSHTYKLRGPWRGQSRADYDFVEPAE